MACSFLDIVSAVLDVLKAVEAYRNGEPGMIVAWMGASATISAISGVLAFYALNAWWSFGITLVLAVITIALAILTMQELTLPQRLWVHRSVFGRPNHNYYNSIPFGGDKPRSLPNDPAAADEWKDYQRRALNEEAQALGMLVTGITLEVYITRPADTNHIGMAPNLHPKIIPSTAYITFSLPEKIVGDILLSITNNNSKNIFSSNTKDLELKYRKNENEIGEITGNVYVCDPSINADNGIFKKTIEYQIMLLEQATVRFGFFEIGEPYKPIASDSVKIRG